MTNLRPIFYVSGIFLVMLSVLMLFPALMDYITGNRGWHTFLSTSFFTLFFGALLTLTFRMDLQSLTTSQAFGITTFSWIILAFFASLPFYFSPYLINFHDAFFEAMSGITTTGATVMVNLDKAEPSILLWRSLLQWLGGVGIIVVAVAVLPILQIGGMQIFRSESSDRSDKVMPRVSQVATGIGVVYVLLTIMCAFSLWYAGIPGFDAILHAMTTVATGGFSSHDNSIAYFQNPFAEWIFIVFIWLSSIPFVLYLRFLKGSPKSIYYDTQVRWMVILFGLLTGVVFAYRWLAMREPLSLETFRETLFNVTSVVSTTGYATTDYSEWGTFALIFVLAGMCLGGCTGSSTGGVKIFRIAVLTTHMWRQMKQMVYPKGVFICTFNRQRVDIQVLASVSLFLFVFILSVLVLAMIMGVFGFDLLTSLSAAFAMISNLGPGLGSTIGPEGNYASFPAGAKWILSFAMLLGRLELYTVLVLFLPMFWRN